MKISKRSWHYRFNNWMDEDFSCVFAHGQFTTCSYIRTTIGSILAALFKVMAILAMGGGVLFLVGSMIVVPIVVFLGNTPPETPAVACVMGWIFAIGGLIVLFVNQCRDWIRNRKSKTKAVKKEPSVFVQAIIDKHNKICTLVTADD